MRPRVPQRKVSVTKESRFGKPFRQTRLQAVVVSIRDIPKLIDEAKRAIGIPGSCIQHTMGSPDNERVPVNQISQFMRRAAYITGLGYQVSSELALYAQIVLINVRRPQTRLDKEHYPTAKWHESRRAKIDVYRGRT